MANGEQSATTVAPVPQTISSGQDGTREKKWTKQHATVPGAPSAGGLTAPHQATSKAFESATRLIDQTVFARNVVPNATCSSNADNPSSKRRNLSRQGHFLPEKPVSSGLLSAMAKQKQQRRNHHGNSRKSKKRLPWFPVGTTPNTIKARAGYAVKLPSTRDPIKPSTVTMNGVQEALTKVQALIPSMPAIVVRMKPKKMAVLRLPSRNSIPMLQLAMGNAKPESAARAFLSGSVLTLTGRWDIAGSAADLNRAAGEEARLQAAEEAARKAREEWVATRTFRPDVAAGMSCEKGDVFHSVDAAAERTGWVKCVKKATGEVGELPAECLKRLSDLGNRLMKTGMWRVAQSAIIAQIRKERDIEKIHFEKWLSVVRETKKKAQTDSERERRTRAAEAARLAAELAAQQYAEQLRLDAEAAERLRLERKAAAATKAVAEDVNAMVAEKKKKKMRFKALPNPVKRRSPPPAEVEKSAVMEYASETLHAGRQQYYKFVWCNKLAHGIDEHITKDELIEALKIINGNLITENQIQFCLLALDSVVEAANNAPFDFRMFCVVAALSERVHAVEGMIGSAMGSLDFNDGHSLQLKILKARKLFYLSDGAMESGCMTFDELEHVCLAGHIDMEMAEQLVEMVEDSGGSEVEFLDFLSYLPLFIQASSNIQSNPLGFRKQARLSRAAGQRKVPKKTFKGMVKKQQNLAAMSLVNNVGHNSVIKKSLSESTMKPKRKAPRRRSTHY